MTDTELHALFDRIVREVGDEGVPIVLNLDSSGNFYSPPAPHLAGASARFDLPRGIAAPPNPTNPTAGGEEGFAGMVRGFLELHRVLVHAKGVYALTMGVHEALGTVYGGSGRGGGVIYNAPPMMRAGHAAAADFITRKYGPQFGRLNDPVYGLMFRLERAPVADVTTLALPTLAYAAIWPEPLELLPHFHGLLNNLHPSAPAAWEHLKTEENFSKLADAVVHFTPLPEEIAANEGHEADAWRPLAALVDRARDVGEAGAATVWQ